MEFESTYAMRFYELFSGQRRPIIYTIETLKEMFQITDKYERINDFTKYVLERAKKELDKKAPYSFEYLPQKTGRKITDFRFISYEIAKNKDMNLEKKKLQKQVSPVWQLSQDVLYYLKEFYGFGTKGIQNNIEVLELASQKLDLVLSESKALVEGKTTSPLLYNGDN